MLQVVHPQYGYIKAQCRFFKEDWSRLGGENTAKRNIHANKLFWIFLFAQNANKNN